MAAAMRSVRSPHNYSDTLNGCLSGCGHAEVLHLLRQLRIHFVGVEQRRLTR
jgi:hypothetical protein